VLLLLVAIVISARSQQSIREEAQQIVDDRQHVSAVETETALLQERITAESTGTAVASVATRTAATNQPIAASGTSQQSAGSSIPPIGSGPTDSGDTSRTIADMTIWITPSEPGGGECLQLDAGSLSISAKLTGRKTDQAVSFSFSRLRGGDDEAFSASLSTTENVGSVPLKGGLYCYSLRNTTPVAKNTPLMQLWDLAEDVSLRMIWRPN
jgi:hypothetical protein